MAWNKKRSYKMGQDAVMVYTAKGKSQQFLGQTIYPETELRIEQYTNFRKKIKTGKIPQPVSTPKNNWRVLVEGRSMEPKSKWFANKAIAVKYATNFMKRHPFGIK